MVKFGENFGNWWKDPVEPSSDAAWRDRMPWFFPSGGGVELHLLADAANLGPGIPHPRNQTSAVVALRLGFWNISRPDMYNGAETLKGGVQDGAAHMVSARCRLHAGVNRKGVIGQHQARHCTMGLGSTWTAQLIPGLKRTHWH